MTVIITMSFVILLKISCSSEDYLRDWTILRSFSLIFVKILSIFRWKCTFLIKIFYMKIYRDIFAHTLNSQTEWEEVTDRSNGSSFSFFRKFQLVWIKLSQFDSIWTATLKNRDCQNGEKGLCTRFCRREIVLVRTSGSNW